MGKKKRKFNREGGGVPSKGDFPIPLVVGKTLTVFTRSVAAATNVFNLSWREATMQMFESRDE